MPHGWFIKTTENSKITYTKTENNIREISLWRHKMEPEIKPTKKSTLTRFYIPLLSSKSVFLNSEFKSYIPML